ncbi:hypothetical protein GCM10010174_26050 [Kutzneria viridogrisea]|uniref:SPP1 Gp6-like portal protein n=1 Tax=Kutzneria viridogrisea TaxID=47990 RepID=A0ABR6BSI4_9PSEU|nr:hypothetical protein [Kutzneria viridogrisea]
MSPGTKLTARLTRWLTPTSTAPRAAVWRPPSLSAAATAPPPALSPALAHSTPVTQEWQARAWTYYRRIGAARQGVDWLAHGLSRCHLYIGVTQPDGAGDPVPLLREQPGTAPGTQVVAGFDPAMLDLAGEVLAELYDGPVGHGDALRKLARCLLVPGECWLIGYPTPPPPGTPPATPDLAPSKDIGHGTSWTVASRQEWMVTGEDEIAVKLPRHPARGPDGWVQLGPGQAVAIPVYQEDPEDALRPTSRFEAVMRDLDELDGLASRVLADIRSRLVSAGLVTVPESAMLATPGHAVGAGVDPLITSLISAAATPIQDQDSPAAHIPLVLRISDEAISRLQHLTFATPFDDQLPVLREAALRAVACGLDIPASVVTGISDLNHWSAWAVSDEAVASHLGPLASLICSTLTREILWPILRASGFTDVERLAVWWNASAIILRPDRSATALDAKRLNLISDRAARRELGFSEDDAPTPAELDRAHQLALAQQHLAAPQAGAEPIDDSGLNEDGGQPNPGHRPNPPSTPTGQPANPPAAPARATT